MWDGISVAHVVIRSLLGPLSAKSGPSFTYDRSVRHYK